MVKGARRVLTVSEDYIDGRLFARVQGRRGATPLFVVLVAIGGIDLLFSLYSVPAVFGVITGRSSCPRPTPSRCWFCGRFSPW